MSGLASHTGGLIDCPACGKVIINDLYCPHCKHYIEEPDQVYPN